MTNPNNQNHIPQVEAIDRVWAGNKVLFDFVGQNKYRMIAYFDASRQMSVAIDKIKDKTKSPWKYHKLPSYMGWDSHNYIKAAFDNKGISHAS